MQTVMNIIGQGLALGAIYLLSALGLTVIYGVMGVVNLAHGDLLMLGSYVVAMTAGALTVPGAIIAAFFVVALVGLVLEALVIRHLQHKAVASMLATWGIALVITQVVIMVFGAQLRYVSLPIASSFAIGFGARLPWWDVVMILCSVGAALGLWWLIARTKFGLQMRAVVADPSVAESLGLRVAHVNRWTFALGCGLAGLGGALIAPIQTVSPEMGVPYLVAAFLVVVLARLGNVRGTILWAMAVGVGYAAVAVPVNDTMASILVWSAALVLVALRRRSLVVARV